MSLQLILDNIQSGVAYASPAAILRDLRSVVGACRQLYATSPVFLARTMELDEYIDKSERTYHWMMKLLPLPTTPAPPSV